MTLGVVLHLLLDSTLYPFVDLNHFILLYPFSWQVFGLPLYWLLAYAFPASLLVILVIALAEGEHHKLASRLGFGK